MGDGDALDNNRITIMTACCCCYNGFLLNETCFGCMESATVCCCEHEVCCKSGAGPLCCICCACRPVFPTTCVKVQLQTLGQIKGNDDGASSGIVIGASGN